MKSVRMEIYSQPWADAWRKYDIREVSGEMSLFNSIRLMFDDCLNTINTEMREIKNDKRNRTGMER